MFQKPGTSKEALSAASTSTSATALVGSLMVEQAAHRLGAGQSTSAAFAKPGTSAFADVAKRTTDVKVTSNFF